MGMGPCQACGLGGEGLVNLASVCGVHTHIIHTYAPPFPPQVQAMSQWLDRCTASAWAEHAGSLHASHGADLGMIELRNLQQQQQAPLLSTAPPWLPPDGSEALMAEGGRALYAALLQAVSACASGLTKHMGSACFEVGGLPAPRHAGVAAVACTRPSLFLL